MTAPEAKLEYRIEREGAKLVAIDSDAETVGVYDSEEEAQAQIAREKKEDAMWGRTKELMRAAVRTIMAEFSVDMETALNQVNSAAGMTILGMEEGDEEPDVERERCGFPERSFLILRNVGLAAAPFHGVKKRVGGAIDSCAGLHAKSC